MFEGKRIIKHKTNIFILTVIFLNFCTQVVAQQKDFVKEDDFGKFLNELINIQVVTDIGRYIVLYEISAPLTIFDRANIQQPVQEKIPEIPVRVPAVSLADIDLHKWASSILGLYNPNPEKPDPRGVSTPSYPDELLDVKKLKFENARLVEAILAIEESLQSENPLMNLVWQISEKIDFAIVGQYQLDMTYPDFVEYLKNENEDQTRGALYAKLTLRF